MTVVGVPRKAPTQSDVAPAGAPQDMSFGGEAQTTGALWKQILRVFVENKLAVLGVAVIVFFLLFCFVGPLIYHTNQTNAQQALTNVFNLKNTPNLPLPPGHYAAGAPGQAGAFFPLGTDGNGFDELGRLMFGGRNSLIVGFAAAGLATFFGVVYGAVSGFVGGWLDAILMRIVDIFLSIPFLLLLIILATIFHPTVQVLIFVIAFVSWLVPARLVRGETLTLRTREYVQAVRVMGGRGTRIIFRHIVPNAIGTIIVNLTFQVADAILFLAALGFLGLGVQTPQTDWGTMVNNGTNLIQVGSWWLIYPVGFCIVAVVIAFNFVGDALRDALEVRLQRR